MINEIISFPQDFENEPKENLFKLLDKIGSNVKFNDETWTCDKLAKSKIDAKASYTIYFKNTVKVYNEWIRFYALAMIEKGNRIKTVKNNISDIKKFFEFLEEYYNSIQLELVDITIINNYRIYLNKEYTSNDTKHGKWSSVSNFYDTMKGADNKFEINPVPSNPFEKKRNDDSKYIPKFVTDQIDVILKDESIPLYIRTCYWILRFIPSRLGEVVKMKLDSFKRTKDGWVLILPMWKQNGGYDKPEIRTIRFKEESVEGNFLLNLIKQQKEYALKLQDKLSVEEKGYLFTYYKSFFLGKTYKTTGEMKYAEYKNTIIVASLNSISEFLYKFGDRYDIKDESGNRYKFTSHYLRHNGITDRLHENFEPVDIRAITNHKNDGMILGNYYHPDKRVIVQKQEKVLERAGKDIGKNEAIFFKGRILNINEMMEKRLLNNIRAHKLKHGICSDITGCKNHYQCIECDYFIPDVNDLPYYESEVKQWTKKVEFFTQQNNQFMKENAEYNLELNMKVLTKIKDTLKNKEK